MSELVEQLEQKVSHAGDIANSITGWENHWTYGNLVNNLPIKKPAVKRFAIISRGYDPEDYSKNLLLRGICSRSS